MTINERDIFAEAMQISSAEERLAFLDRACDGDAELRNRVGGLLDEQDKLGSFLEVPAAAVATVERPVSERVGMQFGPYKLLQQIGEGGMGVVYMADQSEPVKRRVALKVIKPGMDSGQVIARFEAERQAMAMMDHPNVNKVFDAGTTDSGRPYFVMELVKGVPITKYCDEHRLTLQERLQLFVPVCQAIQHAHQKGIIHRDIKPTNILVSLYDGQPVPKVIDFGVAKATAQKLTEKTMFTGFGQLVGTLEYMSPEQAQFNQLDIDTRSDVYSLGVLLYELLTGSTPFDQAQLRTVAFDETLRIIREEEPPKPSTRLSTSETLPAIAANRNVGPARLSKLVRGELDWIVMKCLEKDRSRRYESANGLATDLQRYLADEPVLACPPSAVYRLRKFYRRHQAKFVITTIVAIAILCTIAALGGYLVNRQKQFSLLRADAEEASITAREAMAEQKYELAIEQLSEIRSRLVATPLVTERQLLDTLLHEAQHHQELRSFHELVEQVREVHYFDPDDQKIRALCNKVLVLFSKLRNQPDNDRTLSHQAFEVKLILSEAQKRESIGKDPAAREAALKRSLKTLQEAWDLEPDSPAFYGFRSRLWMSMGNAKARLADVERLYKAKPVTALDHHMIGLDLWQFQGRSEEAIPHFRTALEMEAHLPSLSQMAHAYRDSKHLEQAELCYTAMIALRPNLQYSYLQRGMLYLYQIEKPDLAISDFTKVIKLAPKRWSAYTFRALCYEERGDLTQAAADYTAAYEILGQSLAGAETCYLRSSVLTKLNRFSEAKSDLERAAQWHPRRYANDVAWQFVTGAPELRDPSKALPLAQKAVESNPTDTGFLNTLGVVYYRLGKYPEAIDALHKAIKAGKGGQGCDFFFLAMSYWQLGQHNEARQWYDKAVAWMEENQPPDKELHQFHSETMQVMGLDATPPANLKPQKDGED